MFTLPGFVHAHVKILDLIPDHSGAESCLENETKLLFRIYFPVNYSYSYDYGKRKIEQYQSEISFLPLWLCRLQFR